MRKMRFLIALIILLLSLSGCGSSTPTASSPNTPGSISGMSSSSENKDKSDKEKKDKKNKGEKGDNEADDGQGASIFPPPTTVSATAISATQINVSWSLASGAVGYNIYRSNASAVAVSVLNKINATPVPAGPFGNTGLTPSTTYYYVVTSINASGTESVPSTVVNATTIGVPPVTPTGVAVSGGTGQNTISWNPSANATSYNIYWSTTPGVTPATGTLIASTSSPYIQTGLAAGTTYYYVVTAVNSNGVSAPSAEVSGTTLVAPPAPVSATPVGTTQINVNWTPASGAVGYNIYRSITPNVAISPANKVNATPATAGPFGNTGLTPATTYYYVMTSVSATGVESVASVEVSATTAGLPPAAPTGVTATASVSSNVLSWPAVTGATSYNIYWSTTPGVAPSPATMLASTSTGSYVHTGLTAGTTYYYVITATNANGESLPSVQVSGMPISPLSPPTGVSAYANPNGYLTQTFGQNSIQWINNVPGATSYNIYWSKSPGVVPSSSTFLANVTNSFFYLHNGVTADTMIAPSPTSSALSAATTYYYVVTAANANGESPVSTEVSATMTSPVYDFFGTTYGNNMFVIVGAWGSIFTSPDGVIWTKRIPKFLNVANIYSPYLGELYAVVWGGNKFVAVGRGVAFTSPDGITWTQSAIINTGGAPIYSVTWSGSQFVAVGYGGTRVVSSDGINWSGVTYSGGIVSMEHMRGVAYSGSKFFAIGASTGWTSPDGVAWTNIYPVWVTGGTNLPYFYGITWSGNQFVAVGQTYFGTNTTLNGMIAKSLDGNTWTYGTMDIMTPNALKSVISSGTKLFAVGDAGTVYTSLDGINWTLGTSGTLNNLNALATSGSINLAVGNGGTIVNLR